MSQPLVAVIFVSMFALSLSESASASNDAALSTLETRVASSNELDLANLQSLDDIQEWSILPDPPVKSGWFRWQKFAAETTTQPVPKTTPKNLIGSFFAQPFCSMPKKLAKRLREDREDGNPYIPRPVLNSIEDRIDEEGRLFGEVNLVNVLHRFTVQVGGSTRVEPLESASTYSTLEVQPLIDSNTDSLVYNLDCSGFLTAQAAAGFLSINAEVAGKAEFNKTMLVIYGKVPSPIAMAIRPSISGHKLPDRDRESIVSALALATVDDAPASSVSVPTYFYVLASAKQQGSQLQGSISGNFSGGISVISASSEGGSKYGRRISYSNFDTLLLKPPAGESNRTLQLKVSDVRDAVEELFTRAGAGAKRNQIDGRTVLSLNLSENLCATNWTLAKEDEAGNMQDGYGQIVSEFATSCNLQLMPANNDQLNSLTIVNKDLGLRLRVPS
ncbi:MAG: hypothetical protein JJ854_12115 [Pseudomonadales bacterium]|nr:hypothetical protein [Pseudomonadales bacterium]